MSGTAEARHGELAPLADPRGQPAPYKAVAAPLHAAWRALRARDAASAAAALRGVTASLLARFDLADARVALPAPVRALFPRELERIGRQLADEDASYYDFAVDSFAKDFALLTHRFIPLGAEFAEPDAGVPRGVLRAGAGAAWLMLARARGFRPFFALHAHPRSLGDFNPEGWLATYHRLAELLEANPGVRGMTSASWFLDPALAAVSPRLAYLRAVPEAGGARFFFSARDTRGESGALARSPTRRALFAQGRYVPEVWLRVWLRGDVIAWSRRERTGVAA
jgi:hypothetical protein